MKTRIGSNLNHPRTAAARLFTAALLLTGAGSALADVHYVDVNSTNATPPYTNWTTAATNIQDAVDAAVAGDEIVVTNGLYATGGRAFVGQVVVDKALSLRSVNGAQFTTIDGGQSNRCVYLTNNSSLSGFTLTNGVAYLRGGGLWCESANVVASNCVLSGNFARASQGYYAYGGGAYGGTLNNCTLTANRADAHFSGYAWGGGAYGATLNNCSLSGNRASARNIYSISYLISYAQGGGAYGCTLNNCTLTDNSAFAESVYSSVQPYAQGGGSYGGTLRNCTLTGNWARVSDWLTVFTYAQGGGAYGGTLNDCTLTGNSAFPTSGPASGSGAWRCTLNNCIVYFNNGYDHSQSTLNYSCTPRETLSGVGNITNAPLFVDGNLRLQSNSPCINAGNNSYVTTATDLDGNPRIVGGTVDIGAYEYQSLDLVGFGVVSNRFGFNITGQSNWVIVLEASSNFTNWTSLTTNTLNGGPFSFLDPTPPNLPHRFYRARME